MFTISKMFSILKYLEIPFALNNIITLLHCNTFMWIPLHFINKTIILLG